MNHAFLAFERRPYKLPHSTIASRIQANLWTNTFIRVLHIWYARIFQHINRYTLGRIRKFSCEVYRYCGPDNNGDL